MIKIHIETYDSLNYVGRINGKSKVNTIQGKKFGTRMMYGPLKMMPELEKGMEK